MKSIYQFLAAKKMTLALLAAGALAMMWITYCEARDGGVITPHPHYLGPVFVSLLFLFWLNLLLNCFRASFWKGPRLSLGLSHLSLVLILTGGYCTFTLGIRGDLSIMEGESRAVFRVDEPRLEVRVPGGGHSFLIEEEGRIKPEGWLAALIPWPAGSEVSLANGMTVRILDWLASSRVRQEVLKAPEGQGPPALVLELGGKHPEQVVLRHGEQREMDHPGFERIFYSHQPGDDPIPPELAGRFGESLVIAPPQAEELTFPLAIPGDVGKTFTRAGYSVEVLAYYPDFKVGKEPNLDDPPNNPALRLRVQSPAEEKTLYSFARTEFHGNKLDDGTAIRYQRPEGGNALIFLSRGPDRVEVFESQAVEPHLLTREQRLSLGEGDALLTFKMHDFWPSSLRKTSMVWDPGGMGPPAYQVQVGEGEPAWLCEGRGTAVSAEGDVQALVTHNLGLGFELTLDNSVAEFWPASSIPRAFYSTVTLADPKEAGVINARIETNAPLLRNGFRLYQTSMDMKPPYRWSIFSVAKDPGVPLVTLGFLALMVGLVWLVFYRLVFKGTQSRGGAV